MSLPHPAQSTGRTSHSRNPSTTSAPKADSKVSKRAPMPSPALPEASHFTLLIRLPFPRGEFADPPQVDWDSRKDSALWKIISRSSKTSDLNWEELADRFEVPHAFILQQAAWLYERHLTHIRGQMRKVGTANNTTSSASGAPPTAGGVAMKRLGSGGAKGSRAPSSLSVRSTASPRPEAGSPGTPLAPSTSSGLVPNHDRTDESKGPSTSRNPSTSTVTQSRQNPPSSPKRELQSSFRTSFAPSRRESPATVAPPSRPTLTAQHKKSSGASSPAGLDASSDDTSSSSEDNTNPIRRSQIFKRPPRFDTKRHRPQLSRLDSAEEEDDEDIPADSEEEDSNTFLPFANPNPTSARDRPLSATLRGGEDLTRPKDPPHHPTRQTSRRGKAPEASSSRPQHTAESSTSSISPPFTPISHPSGAGGQQGHQRSTSATTIGRSPSSQGTGNTGPISPRHRIEFARLNQGHPRGSSVHSINSTGSSAAGAPSSTGKGKGHARGDIGSDGGVTSMGSSFSDLDGSISVIRKNEIGQGGSTSRHRRQERMRVRQGQTQGQEQGALGLLREATGKLWKWASGPTGAI